MRINFQVEGFNLEQIVETAKERAKQFFGDRPYELYYETGAMTGREVKNHKGEIVTSCVWEFDVEAEGPNG